MSRDFNDVLREEGVEAARKLDATAIKYQPPTDNADGKVFQLRKPKPHVVDDDDTKAPAFSDEALALRFAEQHAHELRYVSAWSRWMIWDGSQWREDETLKAFDLSRQICRDAAQECNRKKYSAAIASAKTVAAIERLAKADRRLAATVDQWDRDPWLLNTPAGVVDLRTGDCRSHLLTAYATKMTAVAPTASCPIPHWQSFLERATGGDTELVGFLQRIGGYSLTGDTSEHALFFLFGHGANGKTTFMNAVTGAMGDYCRIASIETFTASRTEQHPTDLAGLRGARLVSSVETEEGRRWAESKIKALTGGDKITARKMRQDFFDFTPQFKLFVAGNHKPGLRSVDEAIRRRFYLVPFTVTIPPGERDRKLPERLKAEWPGILQWLVDGCLQWQRDGLAPPKAVTDATAQYLAAEDAIAAWIEDCADIDYAAWHKDTELFESWAGWTQRNGEYAGKRRAFLDRLDSRPGIESKRKGQGRGFVGLRLRITSTF
jgi:putative DNA primase/helicase